MKKRLVGLAVLAFGLAYGAWSQVPVNGKQQNQPTQNEQNNIKPIQPIPPASQVRADITKQVQNADPKPSGYPWQELYAPANIPNWFLVVVGFWAGLMALRTLRSIDRQADQMEGQLREMQKVSDIENKTLILQYRPRILIRNTIVKNFNTELGADGKCSLSFQIVNAGGSTAHIIGGAMSLLSVDAQSIENIQIISGNEGVFEQRTFEPGKRENFEDTLSTNTVIVEEWAKCYRGEKSNCSIYLQGTIWYKDDLNIPRQTGIFRKYDANSRRFAPEKDNEEEYSD